MHGGGAAGFGIHAGFGAGSRQMMGQCRWLCVEALDCVVRPPKADVPNFADESGAVSLALELNGPSVPQGVTEQSFAS